MSRATLTAVLVATLAATAQSMGLCATPKGAIVAGDRCRKREAAVDPRDLGLVGPPGAAGPAGPPGAPRTGPFHVVDADGTTACTPLARLGLRAQCVLDVDPDGEPVQLVLHPDGSDAHPSVRVAYTGGDCTGTPHYQEIASPLTRALLLADTLFVAMEPAAIVSITSVEVLDDECDNGTRTARGTCCVAYPQPVDFYVAAARAIPLSSLGLRAPLRVEDQ